MTQFLWSLEIVFSGGSVEIQSLSLFYLFVNPFTRGIEPAKDIITLRKYFCKIFLKFNSEFLENILECFLPLYNLNKQVSGH